MKYVRFYANRSVIVKPVNSTCSKSATRTASTVICLSAHNELIDADLDLIIK